MVEALDPSKKVLIRGTLLRIWLTGIMKVHGILGSYNKRAHAIVCMLFLAKGYLKSKPHCNINQSHIAIFLLPPQEAQDQSQYLEKSSGKEVQHDQTIFYPCAP